MGWQVLPYQAKESQDYVKNHKSLYNTLMKSAYLHSLPFTPHASRRLQYEREEK